MWTVQVFFIGWVRAWVHACTYVIFSGDKAAFMTLCPSRYKIPFLRGEMDPQLDKHEKIEALMADDIDHWMCNLYIDIVKLPR